MNDPYSDWTHSLDAISTNCANHLMDEEMYITLHLWIILLDFLWSNNNQLKQCLKNVCFCAIAKLSLIFANGLCKLIFCLIICKYYDSFRATEHPSLLFSGINQRYWILDNFANEIAQIGTEVRRRQLCFSEWLWNSSPDICPVMNQESIVPVCSTFMYPTHSTTNLDLSKYLCLL